MEETTQERDDKEELPRPTMVDGRFGLRGRWLLRVARREGEREGEGWEIGGDGCCWRGSFRF
jgi:hypothetical protein